MIHKGKEIDFFWSQRQKNPLVVRKQMAWPAPAKAARIHTEFRHQERFLHFRRHRVSVAKIMISLQSPWLFSKGQGPFGCTALCTKQKSGKTSVHKGEKADLFLVPGRKTKTLVVHRQMVWAALTKAAWWPAGLGRLGELLHSCGIYVYFVKIMTYLQKSWQFKKNHNIFARTTT